MLIIEQAHSITEEPSDVRNPSVQEPCNKGGISEDGEGKGNVIILGISEIVTASKTPPDAFIVDWTKYEPPEGLMYPGGMESDTGLQIIQESINRIKARILEEEEQRLAAETVSQNQKQATSEGNEEVKKPESGNMLHEDSNRANELDQPSTPEQDVSGDVRTGGFSTDLPKRPMKRNLMNLFRRLDSGHEHGESSAAGAARRKLLISSSTAKLTTHSARRRFVSNLVKKATGEDNTYLSPSTSESQVECVSCLDDFDPRDTVRVPCHNYCTPCFRRLIASACQNEQHWPPKCCLNTIPHGTILANVDEAQKAEYHERVREWNVPMADRIYCSQPECGLLIRPEYIIPAQDLARCTDGHYTCTICRNAQHEGNVCPQDHDMMRTNNLAEEEG